MTIEDKGWIASRFARLSTGLKMLLILGLGLFPLGFIAILASIENAHENRLDRTNEIEAKVALTGQRLSSAVYRAALTIRAANATPPGDQRAACDEIVTALAGAQMMAGSFVLYDSQGEPHCATPGFTLPVPKQGNPNETRIVLQGARQAIDVLVYGPSGLIQAAGEFPRESLLNLTAKGRDEDSVELALAQGNAAILLRSDRPNNVVSNAIVRVTPIADGQFYLRETARMMPVTATEVLLILLPIAMWIGAAVIGWFIVNRLLLGPLLRMHKAISAYRPGDRGLDLPILNTPAHEIGALGAAFDEVTRTVARHEANLEAAVERQSQLVREVHHRVKNNLQVIASLLNLHSRGSSNEEVAAAYASIQRRVDALAVVHRNHYASLEENRGVALRALLSELGANLRATAPTSAAGMSISLNIEPYYATQDVAVSIAFLITEIVEFAMFCDAKFVRISLSQNGPGNAALRIESNSLRANVPCDAALFERFDRIITGLSRQLRSTLDRDLEAGVYSLVVAVVDGTNR